jgi:hypothetical protein
MPVAAAGCSVSRYFYEAGSSMFTERPFPAAPRSRNIGIVVGYVVFTAIFVSLGIHFGKVWIAAIPFFVAVPIGWYFFWPRRCPECGGRLISRDEPIGTTSRIRILARCPKCQVDWDTGMVGDTKYDD